MKVKVNSAVWGSIFAVPTCIADDHIKMAGGQQLKVLLFVLRHHNEDIDTKDIASGVGLTESDVKDALGYWIETGIVSLDGETPKKIKLAPKDAEKKEELHALPDVVPTYEQVASRLLEDKNLKDLFFEVQLKLGRTIGYGDQAKLLMMHDYYGLPVEVILTVVEYCVSINKASMSYIGKVAKNWGENEITTLEAADAKLRELRDDERLWKKFASMFTVDPPKYTDIRFSLLKKWYSVNKQSLELIYYAYELMIERINKVDFRYMDRILESWKEKGLRKPQEVIQAESKRTDNLNKPSPSGKRSKNTSYDSDKVKEKAQAPIEYKRRNT